MTTLFWTLWSNSHFWRGFSSYSGSAALNSARRPARMASTTRWSQTSTEPSQMQGAANATYSPSPLNMPTASLVGCPVVGSTVNLRLWTLSKHLERCLTISCGFVPLARMSSRSAGETK